METVKFMCEKAKDSIAFMNCEPRASQNVVMAADKFGKIKMIIQVIALPMLFLVSFLTYNITINSTVLLVCQIISILLSYEKSPATNLSNLR